MSGARPPSGAMRVGTAARGRVGMASSMGRPLGTGMVPMTGRPGTRGGMVGGGALNAAIHVSDRPVTRQGLGGIKTQSQGPQRQVQDKSYWLGLLRGKINDLNSEIGVLTKEINQFNQENATYMSYEKRAEVMAAEIKVLQGELADYNCVVNKLNTNSGFEDLIQDCDDMKAENEKEGNVINEIFAKKQEKEKALAQLEIEMDQERRMTDSLVADMPANLREKYAMLKNRNIHLQGDLESKQLELDGLVAKIDEVEAEVSQSAVKQAAVTLYEKIYELEEKKSSLLDEIKKKESPAEERERLLNQVKDDNLEIVRMESRTREIQEKMEKLQDELSQLDMDLEQQHGERTSKYKDLKKREEEMQKFMDNFEENKKIQEEKKKEIEASIVDLLEAISRTTVQSKHMPSSSQLDAIKEDLDFKSNEMHKSKDTASGLDHEHAKLQSDLEKVDQLGQKINTELNSLRGRIDKMTEELVLYSDLAALRKKADERKTELTKEREEMIKGKARLTSDTSIMQKKYDARKSKLEENETYAQLGNLERKWQHLEQNNFAIKEFIAQKKAESNFEPLKENVNKFVYQINQEIIKNLTSNTK